MGAPLSPKLLFIISGIGCIAGLLLFSIVAVALAPSRGLDFLTQEMFILDIVVLVLSVIGIVVTALSIFVMQQIPRLVTVIVIAVVGLFAFCVACYNCSLANKAFDVYVDLAEYVNKECESDPSSCADLRTKYGNAMERLNGHVDLESRACQRSMQSESNFNDCYNPVLNLVALVYGVPGIILGLAAVAISIFAFILERKDGGEGGNEAAV